MTKMRGERQSGERESEGVRRARQKQVVLDERALSGESEKWNMNAPMCSVSVLT